MKLESLMTQLDFGFLLKHTLDQLATRFDAAQWSLSIAWSGSCILNSHAWDISPWTQSFCVEGNRKDVSSLLRFFISQPPEPHAMVAATVFEEND